jgi:hypothetical protein
MTWPADSAVGDDQERRLQGDDARDAAVDHFGFGLAQVGDFAPADDLHAVGVDVVQVADQVGGRARITDRGVVEPALWMAVTRHPFPAQGRAVLLEQRLGADGGGLHAGSPGPRPRI